MRRLIVIPLCLISFILGANTYYISPTGSDAAAGTLAAPWATWQKGFTELVAGDTLYIRGGTYQPIGTFIYNPFGTDWYACAGVNNVDGTEENPIVVINYPGEHPILDCVNNTQANNGGAGSRFAILMRSCSYWHLIGLEVKNLPQLTGEIGVGGVQFFSYSHYNRLERLSVHDIGGSGIRIIYDCNGNLIYNCDSYDNMDPLSVPTPYNNSDGIEIADITDTSYVNTIRGCRLWDNSDDGIDLMRNEGKVIVDSTWCFYNGQTADYSATGFKLGQTSSEVPALTTKRLVTNCIAAYNNSAGFFANVSYQKMELYNNLSIGNEGHGFFWYINGTSGGPSVFRNNISIYNDSYQYSWIYTSIYTFDHNNWDPIYDQTGPIADPSDFVTLDTLGFRYSRKPNGSLPDIRFGKLAEDSDLINAGINVGIDYVGAAPDLGPFEYDPGVPVVPSGDGLFGKSRLGIQLKDKDGKLITL